MQNKILSPQEQYYHALKELGLAKAKYHRELLQRFDKVLEDIFSERDSVSSEAIPAYDEFTEYLEFHPYSIPIVVETLHQYKPGKFNLGELEKLLLKQIIPPQKQEENKPEQEPNYKKQSKSKKGKVSRGARYIKGYDVARMIIAKEREYKIPKDLLPNLKAAYMRLYSYVRRHKEDIRTTTKSGRLRYNVRDIRKSMPYLANEKLVDNW